MDGVTILGYGAATLTTCAFLPQVFQIWRSKSTKDISLPMLLTFIVGISIWFVYGVLVNSAPVVVANLITLVLNLLILFFKLRYG